MKKIITLLALSFTLLSISGPTVSGSLKENTTLKTEARAKQEQAKQLKAQCPHYPSAQSYDGGISKTLVDTFESWKKNYPEEYASYLKIFNYTR